MKTDALYILAEEMERKWHDPAAVISIDDPEFLQGQLAINRAESMAVDRLLREGPTSHPTHGLTGRVRELTEEYPPRKFDKQVRRIG